MANVNAIYQSEFLRAEQIKGKAPRVTIEGATVEVLGQGDQARNRIVLKFSNCGPRLPLNKTNVSLLASAFGPETANWIGRVIELRCERVMFSGQLVDAIRVSVPPDGARPAPAAQPVAVAPAPVPAQPVPPQPGGFEQMKDDVPW